MKWFKYYFKNVELVEILKDIFLIIVCLFITMFIAGFTVNWWWKDSFFHIVNFMLIMLCTMNIVLWFYVWRHFVEKYEDYFHK
jgi:hypothetical protein